MDNKLNVRALAKSAIARTFIIFLLLFCFNSNVYATEYNMPQELAEEILDYYKQGSNYWAGNPTYISAYGGTVQNILNSLTPKNFATYFNSYMGQANFEKTGEFQNLTVLFEVLYGGECRFTFFQTNNMAPYGLELPFLNLYNNSYGETRFVFNGTDSLTDNTAKNIDYLNLVFNSSGLSNSTSSGTSNDFTRNLYNITFNSDETIVYIPSLLGLTKTQVIYYTPYGLQKNNYFIGNTVNGNYGTPPSDLPSGDGEIITSGDISSGDYTAGVIAINNNIIKIHDGIVELNGKIATSGDIQNIISAETNKIIDFMSGDANFENKEISSGDILEAIDYNPPDDPYANFWFELTNILNNAFTGSLREITITGYTGKPYKISIDDIRWNPPAVLRTFLTLASTTAVGIAILKWIKIMVDKISSGSIDDVLEANEEGIVNLF